MQGVNKHLPPEQTGTAIIQCEINQQLEFLEEYYATYSSTPTENLNKLSSALEIWQNAPVTLLREHYRCHPKIINFCNQKFYHGQLIVMTKDHDEPNVLTMYRTTAVKHARGHLNQRQIEVIQSRVYSVFDMLYQGYAEQRRAYLQKHKRISEYDSENLMYSVIQELLSEETFSSIGCAVHVSLATMVKDCEPLTEEERQYARNPLTHVDFLLFNQMDKQPVLAIEVDGTGFHEVGSKQAKRDIKKNSVLEKCAVPLLRLRTDGSGEKEKIRNALKRD